MEPEEYERESQCQDYEDYGPDGYHPVRIGEQFNNNLYSVVQKLGWGHFSTVWLVNKKQTKQHFALKIQRSKQSHMQSAIEQLQMLTQLRKHQADPEWLQFLATQQSENPQKINSKLCRPLLLVDNFVHQGIHGKHMCSVFELMGPNLLDLIHHYEYKQKRMPLWLVKKITRDVLLGLVYLHQRCNIIHTDLKPENIMIKLEDYEEKQLIEQLKGYKVKPLSMKFLKKLQTSKNSKKIKKLQKKKGKKAKSSQDQNYQSQDQENQSGQVSHSQSNISSVSQLVSNSQNSQESFSNNKGLAQQQHFPRNINAQIIKQKHQIHVQITLKQVKNPQHNSISEQRKNKAQLPQASNRPIKNQTNSQDEQQVDIRDGVDMSVLVWKNVKIRLSDKLFFKIVDLGNACFANNHFTQDIQTREYRSPEVITGHQYYHNTDIFSLACVVFEMMTNSFLFKPENSIIGKEEDHLYQMLQILGPIPQDFRLAGKLSHRYFNENGKLKHGNPPVVLPLSLLFVQKFDYLQQTAKAAQQFLMPMLAYDPKNRVDARACLKSKWLWT